MVLGREVLERQRLCLDTLCNSLRGGRGVREMET